MGRNDSAARTNRREPSGSGTGQGLTAHVGEDGNKVRNRGRAEAGRWRLHAGSRPDRDEVRLANVSPARRTPVRRARLEEVPVGDIEAAAGASASAITVTGTVLSHATGAVANAVVNTYYRIPGGFTLTGSGISDKNGQYRRRIRKALRSAVREGIIGEPPDADLSALFDGLRAERSDRTPVVDLLSPSADAVPHSLGNVLRKNKIGSLATYGMPAARPAGKKRAACLAALHANTPAETHFDSPGRSVRQRPRRAAVFDWTGARSALSSRGARGERLRRSPGAAVSRRDRRRTGTGRSHRCRPGH